MAGAGGVGLAACWWERKYSELRDFAAVTGAWLISFSCQYFLFVRPDLQANGVYLIDFWREHEGFMAALANRDAQLFARLLRDHSHHTGEVVCRRLRERAALSPPK